MKNLILLTLSILIPGIASLAQERGNPYMTIYKSTQIGGHPQNWAFQEDDRGVMYIGNGYGVLEFDGSRWRLIRNPNSSFAKSFGKDSTGRIYVGASAELGYLAPDVKGAMRYVSLLGYMNPEDRAFTYVWETVTTPMGIFFRTLERLFRYNWIPPANGNDGSWQVKVWKTSSSESVFRYSTCINGTLYVHEQPGGLLKMVGDSLVPVPDGQRLSNMRLRFMVSFPGRKGTFLLGTQNNGLYVWDGTSIQPFLTDAGSYFDRGIYDCKALPDGTLAIGSILDGLLIINQQGKLVRQLSVESGLPSNSIKSIFIDRQSNIWLALEDGLAMIEFASGLSLFDQRSGMNDIVRYRGILYLSTSNGVFYLDPKDSQIKAVQGCPPFQTGFFTIANGNLYVCSQRDILRIEGITSRVAFRGEGLVQTLQIVLPVKSDSTRFLCGTMGGIVVLRMDPVKQQFVFEGDIPDIFEYVYKIVEYRPGVFWIGTFDAGALRLTINDHDYANPLIERFGKENGLPQGTALAYQISGRLVFSSPAGYLSFDDEKQQFRPDTLFRDLNYGVNPGESFITNDEAGNIWVNGGRETVLYRLMADGSYRMEKSQFARFSDEMVNLLYPEKDGTAWFGMSKGLIRYLPAENRSAAVPWKALIRSVQFSNDTILTRSGNAKTDLIQDKPRIPFHQNALTFSYSALSYVKPESNEFQIKLEGYDKEWSAWSREKRHNYTNLSPGIYTFRVRARNLTGQESMEDNFGFTIITPWYSTWWSYFLYFIVAGLSVYALVHFRTRKLRERSGILEKIVLERTAEIQEQKNNVEQLSKIGKDITASLSIKNIIQTIYENVNTLMDASIFGIGLHNPEENSLEFPGTIEKNQPLLPFSVSLDSQDRLAVWCFKHQQDVIINDFRSDYSKYIGQLHPDLAGENPESILYLPLWNKNKVIGVITAQSFNKQAYSNYQLNMLRNLATYSAIAMENADAYKRLADLLEDLKATQDKLVTQSKLAALGALTAGIAHEIKNPLNFVNNFAGLNAELVEELQQQMVESKAFISPDKMAEIGEVLSILRQNSAKILEHGKRADSIVLSMLQHSRTGTGELQPTDINSMLEEAIRLTNHGMIAQDANFSITLETSFDKSIGKLNVIPQEINRAFLNILNNACYEAYLKKKDMTIGFLPVLSVRTLKQGNSVEIRIRDNGNGIPMAIREKLFTPFFTTKPSGQGAGLGLSICYDIIVQKHNGRISFESEEGSFTEFVIRLPGNK